MHDWLPLLRFRSGAPGTTSVAVLRFVAVAWPRGGAPALRSLICCRCFRLEVEMQWCPSAKMYDFLPLHWSRRSAPVLRCTICCRCFGLEVVPMLRCTVVLSRTACCRYFGLEVVPQCQKGRFVAVALVMKCYHIVNMYDFLPLLWSRNGAPVLCNSICCRFFGLHMVLQC